MELKRLLGIRTNQKHPVTLDLLRRIRLLTRQSSACFSELSSPFISFHRLIRQAFDPEKHLKREYLSGSISPFRWSKTRQHRKDILLVFLPSMAGSELCPVAAIRHYFSLVPAPSCSPTGNRGRNGEKHSSVSEDYAWFPGRRPVLAGCPPLRLEVRRAENLL